MLPMVNSVFYDLISNEQPANWIHFRKILSLTKRRKGSIANLVFLRAVMCSSATTTNFISFPGTTPTTKNSWKMQDKMYVLVIFLGDQLILELKEKERSIPNTFWNQLSTSVITSSSRRFIFPIVSWGLTGVKRVITGQLATEDLDT